eukprot:TRINITY_DN4631_c0_g2_i1.p1 TRINITY_DN4631_c0_g2~~TRINITY_DN4631_c0_g2_i1.p1  ORF type:complete len:494 (-),score=114.09 TRINITY_DN4631_c0_g2_i1:78-1559(-)
MATNKILLLGSGMVVQPVVDYLLRDGVNSKNDLTIVSLFLREAETAAQGHPPSHTHTIELDVAKNDEKLSSLVSNSDIVISLLPNTMHSLVAKHCITHKKNLLTASYINPAMKEFDAPAKEAGLIFLNELGLDPGIDHMSAMSIIDSAKERGGKITGFVSWCGALPAPDCNENPLRYKFSWSPRGVLSSASLPSTFLYNNEMVSLTSVMKWALAQHVPIDHVNHSKHIEHFDFEGVGNRDSVSYIDTLQLNKEDVKTMLRGTLRWPGFGVMVRAFMALGLFKTDVLDILREGSEPLNWNNFMKVFLGGQTTDNEDWLFEKASFLINEDFSHKIEAAKFPSVKRNPKEDVEHALNGLKWLGILGAGESVVKRETPIDCLCALLEKKLSYLPGERDIVVMQHEFTVEYPSHKEKIYSTLVVFGDNDQSVISGAWHKSTGTAKTVGIPVAIAAELVLSGKVPQRGVVAPIFKEIYLPILDTLKKYGIELIKRVEKL